MKTYLIRNNTQKLRDKLEEIGYTLCSCTVPCFDNEYLFTTDTKYVHSIFDDDKDIILLEIQEGISDLIDCRDNEEMFLKLAEKAIKNEL